MATKPIIFIVGPTASGKTGASIRLAKQFGGEIICADSRTVYKGMDIGTAKPTAEEQDGIAHWGLDIAGPDERYTAAQFKEYATKKIDEIRSRNKVPFIVGGTGLYVDAVLFDYQFPKPMDTKTRQQMETMSTEELFKYCVDNNIELPVDDKNKRRLLRAISDPERTQQRSIAPSRDFIVVGIATESRILRERITLRTDAMFEDGVIDEATTLAKQYGWDAEAMTSNVYREIRRYLDGSASVDEVKELFRTRDWQLAKRQMTWFRRNAYIEWCTLQTLESHVARLLAHE